VHVLLSWLREFAPDIDGDPVALGETLSDLGLAVEEMTITGESVSDIVVAKVLELSPHPDADRIQLVQVDAGDGEALQVACGAFNMEVGDLIPFAPIGATMPNGMEIGRRKMRGEWSNGMCCSSTELELGDDSDGILILSADAGFSAEPGTPLTEALGIERDVLWDLEVNANRPDALSVAGVARDLAAGLGVPFSFPHHELAETDELVSELASVDIIDPSLCGRFIARVLRNVTVGASPRWMANRLTQLGMRPINSVVDVSNYVMLELGQPNHTYDLAKVPNGALRVRRAGDGETIVTLDDVERTLISSDGVIANEADEAIGIAGVMGGASTEISETTTDVLLEAAWWDPPSISRTVKRLQLRSEASQRYQRGADWGENMDRAVRRFAQLLAESGVTTTSGQIDERGDLPDRSPIVVRTSKVNGVLGTDLGAPDMSRHLTSIGFGAEVNGDDLQVVIPTWRWDTENETDIAEEVGRMFGYANLPRTVPKGDQAGGLSPYQKTRRAVRQILVGVGVDEGQPMPFLAPGDLERAGLPDEGIVLSNPLVAEESVLRTSLLPGMLKALAYNESHRLGEVSLFEIGHIFPPAAAGEPLPDEHEVLAVALGASEAPAAVEVLDVLADALALGTPDLVSAEVDGMHPTRTASVRFDGVERGAVGEVDPDVLTAFGVSGRVGWLQLDLERLLRDVERDHSYAPVSKFPSSDLDLAFETPGSVPASAVVQALRVGGGELLVDLALFDVFRGEQVRDGSRSLAYRLRFQAADRTLTDDELAAVRQQCIDAVAAAGAELRA
jgi:phenylalanyl-tRNA synthetase beta chain